MRKESDLDMQGEKAKGEILVYQSDDGKIRLDVRLERETLWMTQSDMARLFQCSTDNISLHLKNIYDERELDASATTEEFSTVRQEGARQVQRRLTFYNLDVVISVGYRVKSLIATRFRIWATQRLKEYIVKGFTMDDERLKNPPVKGSAVPDYFDEFEYDLVERPFCERLQIMGWTWLPGDVDVPELIERRSLRVALPIRGSREVHP